MAEELTMVVEEPTMVEEPAARVEVLGTEEVLVVLG